MGFYVYEKQDKMMKKILLLMFVSIFLVYTISLVNAEIIAWNGVVTDEVEQTATYIGNYKLDDTSANSIGTSKEVELALWYSVQDIPFNLVTYGGSVDWCNFTVIHYQNVYSLLVNNLIINETTETTNLYFSTGNFTSGLVTIKMKAEDFVSARMVCHYTNVSALQMGTKGYNSLDEVIVGRFDSLLPAFECDKCEGHSLEDLTNEFEQIDSRTASELSIYDWIQTLVGYNYSLWLYASWIIKILLLFVAVGLIFGSVYWIYDFFNKLARRI